MNIIDRQTTLGRSLFEINTNTFTELLNLQRENVTTYFETLREFGTRLPEIKDIAGFVSLQSEYGESVWNNTRSTLTTQSGIVRSAFEDTRDAIQTAFTASEEAETAAPVEAEKSEETVAEVKPKGRSKAKAAAKADA